MADVEIINLVARAKDEASAALRAATGSMDEFGNSAQRNSAKFNDSIGISRGSLREFKRAGSELGAVARALGDDFGVASGEFVGLAGDAALLTNAVADLGPSALRGAQGIIAAGTAAAASRVEMVALDVASSGLTATFGKLALGLGVLVPILLEAKLAYDHVTGATGDMDNELNHNRDTVVEWIASAGSATQATYDLSAATRDHDGALGLVSDGLTKFNQIMYLSTTQYFRQFTTAAGETGAGLDNVLGRAIAAAQGLDIVGGKAIDSGNDALKAAGAYNALAAAIASAGQGTAQGAGVEGQGHPAGFLPGTGPFGNVGASIDLPKLTKSHSGGGGGGSKAAAHSVAQDWSKAFSVAKTSMDNYFDAQHNANLKSIKNTHDAALRSIKDSHDVANARIKDARKAADAALAEQKRINAEPVTAAEQALARREAAQQERDLREALATAQAGDNGIVDPKQVRDAQEALDNFLDQQKIDLLKVQQDLNDQAAEQAHDATIAALDAQQAAEDASYDSAVAAENKKYQLQVDSENTRYNQLKSAYDDELAQLEEHLKKVKTTHQAVLDLINSLYDKTTGKLKGQATAVQTGPNSIELRAQGGPVYTGHQYMVGERGPELFTPGQSGSITPNGTALTLAPGSIVIHGAGDPAAVADAVILRLKREMNRQGMNLTASPTF